GEDEDGLVAALDDVSETIDERGFDPDEDEEVIAELLDTTDGLHNDLDDAEEWDDLSVRQKLDVEGFYDVLTPETRKDFPPEWNASMVYEKRSVPERIRRGLEMFDWECMQGHCSESLKGMGSPVSYEAMDKRAQKRDNPPIEALGK